MPRVFLFLALWSLFSFTSSPSLLENPIAKELLVEGRALSNAEGQTILIGSASSVSLLFNGDSCVAQLRNQASGDDYNYVSIELDNAFYGRFKVSGNSSSYITVNATPSKAPHLLKIFKATEAQNGMVIVEGFKADKIKKPNTKKKPLIEFIGNSITCGMGNDISETPCGGAKWYDQHNAYFAYGPVLSRKLDVNFMLSSVSGIGIYRNWNSDGPVMPEVYESAYLTKDSTQRWDFKTKTPDIVSIALGTNDLSDGDGIKKRLPFDSSLFVTNYIKFLKTVYSHYPKTQLVLLSSPMLDGQKAKLLFNCLIAVKEEVTLSVPGIKPIVLYRFKPMQPKGCSYHPSKEDHQKLANELEGVFKELVGR